MKILVASDHAGFELKQALQAIKKIGAESLEWADLGPFDTASVDYPDYADSVAKRMNEISGSSTDDSLNNKVIGLLICGSGQGMSMRANKYPKVRAALCFTEEMAQLSRSHNNANILCLGARMTSSTQAEKILQVFVSTAFEGGRHAKRVSKLNSSF